MAKKSQDDVAAARCPHCGQSLPACDGAGGPGARFWAVTPFVLGILGLVTAISIHELWAFLSSILLGALAMGLGAFGLRRDPGSLALSGLIIGAITVTFMLVVLGIAVTLGDI